MVLLGQTSQSFRPRFGRDSASAVSVSCREFAAAAWLAARMKCPHAAADATIVYASPVERLASGRVLPNLHIKVNDIWVKGGPWHTKVFVQWDTTATSN